MKKKTLKQLLSLLLVVATMLGLLACGKPNVEEPSASVEEPTSNEAVQEAPAVAEGITFPLAEEMTFEIVIPGTAEQVELLEKCKLWADL